MSENKDHRREFIDAGKAIEIAAKKRAEHLKDESAMRPGKSGKLRRILQEERKLYGTEDDQW